MLVEFDIFKESSREGITKSLEYLSFMTINWAVIYLRLLLNLGSISFRNELSSSQYPALLESAWVMLFLLCIFSWCTQEVFLHLHTQSISVYFQSHHWDRGCFLSHLSSFIIKSRLLFACAPIIGRERDLMKLWIHWTLKIGIKCLLQIPFCRMTQILSRKQMR